MPKINIAIIAGGFSNEREISLLSAGQIAQALPTDKYEVKIIEITPDKKWLLRPDLKAIGEQSTGHELLSSQTTPDKLDLPSIDVVFLSLHGKFGEDGRIQAILDYQGVPYTGSGVLASALGMNKIKCLEILYSHGIVIPQHVVLYKNPESLDEFDGLISKSFGYPVVVKPNESGSSIGVSLVKDFSELKKAVDLAFKEDKIVLVEEMIVGRELTCPVMGNTGQTELTALPPVEIIPHESKFFDYQAKYFSKKTEEICPANIGPELTAKIQDLSKKIHAILGCDGLTRSDFILKDNELYFIEINTIPGQTAASLAPKSAKVAGMSFAEFLEKQIELARQK
ncbi:MAG: D-alanine--D-alanine ligase [bacterium]